MRHIAESFFKWIKRLVYVPAILAIISLLFIAITDRYVLDGELGLVWIEELCIIITIWLIFLSVITIDREDLHIRVTLFDFRSTWASVLEDLCMAGFALFLVWTTLSVLPNLWSTYAALGWSIKVGYIAIVVGGVLVLGAKILKYLAPVLRR